MDDKIIRFDRLALGFHETSSAHSGLGQALALRGAESGLGDESRIALIPMKGRLDYLE